MRWIVYILLGAVVLAATGLAAFKLSPWPTVLIVRHLFDKDSAARNEALRKHVPANVAAMVDQPYGEGADLKLDVFMPAEGSGPLPTVVWVHGGGFIAGSRKDVEPYLKILAGRGYATVGVGYTRAPTARYPTPVLQANDALAFLAANAQKYRIDASRIVLAGDSAGSQIASQLAAGISDPAYAAATGFAPAIDRSQLRGAVLMCGVYDSSAIDLDGAFAGFIRTVLWSYLGTVDFAGDPRLDQFSVGRHLTGDFPPTFISVGNADPLKPQSLLISEAIAAKGVELQTLFFPDDHQPPLPHEYQFNLDGEAGQQALEQLAGFLARVTGP